MNDNLSGIFERILGIFIILTGISAFILACNEQTSHITSVKQNYANDQVYSEQSLAVTDENNISRDELLMLLVGRPNKNITVKDEVSDYVLEIQCGIGIENSIKITHGDSLSGNVKVINFGKNRWDVSHLELDKWLGAKNFTKKDIVDVKGNIKSVYYLGKDTN